MQVCNLGVRDLLKKAIQNDIQNDPRTNGMQEGQVYEATEDRVTALNQIGQNYGSTIYRIEPGGENLLFTLNVSEDTVNSYQHTQSGNPGRSPFQRATRNDKSDSTLTQIAEGLRNQIAGDVAKLNNYADNVLLSAKRVSSMVEDASLKEAMSEVWTSLRQDPHAEAKLKMVAQYLSEAKNFLQLKRKELAGYDLSDPSLLDSNQLIVIEIEKSVDVYAPLIEEFYRDTINGPIDNPVRKIVVEAHDALQEIKKRAAAVHKDTIVQEMVGSLTPKFEKAKAEMEAQVAKLVAQKDKASDRQKLAIDKKIAKLKADFEELAPSKENIENTLIGKAADSTWVGKFFVAGMMNKDLLVQGFMKKIKDTLFTAQEEFRAIGAEIGQRFQALKISTANIDEAFRELHVTIPEFFYNEETGEIEEANTLYFVSEQDENWRTEHSRLKAEMSKLGHNLLVRRRENAPQDEIQTLEEQYDAAKTKYIQWRRENFEPEYGERYQAADALLDTPVQVNGRTVTPREVRASYFDTISAIQARAFSLNGVPSEEDVEEINRLRLEYETLKSLEGKAEGTGEYIMADLFTRHASEMKEMTDRWEVPAGSLDRFNMRKASIDSKFEDGLITEEERDRWYATNTTTVYDNKYWLERKDAVDKLNSIAEAIQRITGFAKETSLKGNYERMEAICKKYRDHNSHIDGSKLTAEEQAAVLQLEEQIEMLKAGMQTAYSGFLGEEFKAVYDELQTQRASIAEQIAQLRRDDPTRSDFTKQKISELRKQLKEMRASEKTLASNYLSARGVGPEDIASFQKLYTEYRSAIRNLSELTEGMQTKYYWDTYQSELNKLVASKSEEERRLKINRANTVRIGNKRYKKVMVNGEAVFQAVLLDNSLDDQDTLPGEAILDHLFKKEFESSAWYRENHFEAERYDSGADEMVTKMVPIYAWRISQPANKRYIKEHAPNISWKRRVIKDEYRNPNFTYALDGLPNLRAGLHRNTRYEALRANNPELWAFRDYLIDQFKQVQINDLPVGKTLGMRVPSIARDQSLYDAILRRGKGYGDLIKRKFKLNPQDVDEELYAFSDEAGYERKYIPVRFQGRLDADIASKNIVETIGQYIAHAKQFKARNHLVDLAKSLETTLAFQNHAPSSETLDKSARYFGIFKRNKKRGQNERLDSIRNMMDMFVYGENIAQEERTENGKKIHKWMSNLLGMRASLLFSELPNIVSASVGGGGRVLGSGWAQVVNLFGGEFQQLVKTAIKSGSARFSMTDYLWAKKEYAASSAGFINDIGKVSDRTFWTEFAELFDARELHYTDNFGKQLYSKGLLRQVNMHNLAFFKNAVEHELMMTTVIAFAKGYHVDSPSGKVSLKDAFKKENGRLVPTVPISEDEMSNIRGYIATLLRDINGNYGKMDKVMVEQYWVGRAIMFMRKWMIPMIVNRYGPQRFSIEQDRVIQGYISHSFKLAWNSISGFKDTGFNGIGSLFLPEIGVHLSDDEKDALRKTRFEVFMLMMMYIGYRFALGYDPEDEDRFKKLEKESYAMQGFTYSLIKATSEQSTFMPLAGLDELHKLKSNLLSNTAPVVEDLFQIVRKDINWDLDPETPFFEEYKRDSGANKKGDTKAAAHLWKLLGLTSVKESPLEGIKSFERNLNK